MSAQTIPGTRRSASAPTATILRCSDRFCSGDGGPVPAGYHVPLAGEQATTKHRTSCSVCGNAIVVPVAPDVG